jgi:hypothetical protein
MLPEVRSRRRLSRLGLFALEDPGPRVIPPAPKSCASNRSARLCPEARRFDGRPNAPRPVTSFTPLHMCTLPNHMRRRRSKPLPPRPMLSGSKGGLPRRALQNSRFTHAIVEAQHRSDPPLAVACIFLHDRIDRGSDSLSPETLSRFVVRGYAHLPAAWPALE